MYSMGYNNYAQLIRRRGFRGGSRRRRYGTGGRRRYSGARRGYRRVRGYKRRKTPFGKRVKRQAVRAGMRSSKQYGSICRDLGTMFPECLSVKIYMHFQHPLQRLGDVQENFAAYNHFIRVYPFRPCRWWGDGAIPGTTVVTPLTGYSGLDTQSAMGFLRLVGTSGANAMYRECLVVSMAHDLKLDLNDNMDLSIGDTATNRVIPPMRHMYHVYDTSGTAQAAPTSQALSDQYVQQPDVKMKVSGSHNITWPTNGDNSAPSTMTVLPGHRLRWRGTIWPHKTQEIPLETYIGDKNNWGSSSALPTQYAVLQISGISAGTTDAATTTAGTTVRGIVTGALCFTCLLKTPIAAVT